MIKGPNGPIYLGKHLPRIGNHDLQPKPMAIKLFAYFQDDVPVQIEYKHFTFSAGEEQVRIIGGDKLKGASKVTILADIKGSGNLVEFLMVLNALGNLDIPLRRVLRGGKPCMVGPELEIVMPYLPYSRQDRVCYPGEAFGLKAFLETLVTSTPLCFIGPITLTTWDVHSKVASEVLEEIDGWHDFDFNNITVDRLLHWFPEFEQLVNSAKANNDVVIVAPDKGAMARAQLAAKAMGVPYEDIVYGEKVRDPDTGNILGLILFKEGDPRAIGRVHLYPGSLYSDSIEGKKLLIVDDICDGGRTFIELAKLLREFNPASITLYVTHGIFSKGFDVFKGEDGKPLIDNFLVANTFRLDPLSGYQSGYQWPINSTLLSEFTTPLNPNLR